MSKKSNKPTTKKTTKATAKQRALATISGAMNEPLSLATHAAADQADPNLAPIHPDVETRGTAPAEAPAKKAHKAPEPKKEKKPSGLDLAAQVLKKAGEPLNAKQILDGCLTFGWKTSGKTPGATIYAAIIREIMQKGNAARFRKTDRGLFTVAQ